EIIAAVEEALILVQPDEFAVRQEQRVSAGHRIGDVDGKRKQHEHAEYQHVRGKEEGGHDIGAAKLLEAAQWRVEDTREQGHRRDDDGAGPASDPRVGFRRHADTLYLDASATCALMSSSMRVKASSIDSSPAIAWLMRVTSAP